MKLIVIGAANMFTMKYLVKTSIKDNLKLRDNDSLLTSHIIKKIEGDNLDSMSANDLLSAIEDGKYGTFEGIRRSRQKWQETEQELRGKKWKQRQLSQGFVVEQLTFWDLEI